MQKSPTKDEKNTNEELMLDIESNHIDEKIAKLKEEGVKKDITYNSN